MHERERSSSGAGPPPSVDGPRPRIASTRHTRIVLGVLAAVAIGGALGRGRAGVPTSAERAALYVQLVLLQAALVALVRRGVARAGGSLAALVAGGWRSARAVAVDVAIAGGFWAAWEAASRIAAPLVRSGDGGLDPLLPRGPAEAALWIAVSVAAGFGEELTFRGYLQRQLGAIARSRAAGVVLQAVIFGAVHAYQGARKVAVITIVGLLYGILAEARGSLRPGMIAHAWTDVFGGLVLRG